MKMRKIIFPKKFFRFQEKSGWCGPAVIHMVLIASGIKKTQSQISSDTYLPWWGTNHETIYSYLAQFFTKLGFIANAALSDLATHVDRDELVIVNWWDDLDPSDPEGHYSLVLAVNRKKGTLTIADPSSGRGIWNIKIKKFVKRWYDYMDLRREKKIRRWMLWVDPSSKIGYPTV